MNKERDEEKRDRVLQLTLRDKLPARLVSSRLGIFPGAKNKENRK